MTESDTCSSITLSFTLFTNFYEFKQKDANVKEALREISCLSVSNTDALLD